MHKVVSLLVCLLFATSSVQAYQFEQPLQPKQVLVQVYDTFTGLPLEGAPVAMEGHSRMVTTDEDGYAFVTFGGGLDPEVKTFWTSPSGKTIGFGDVTVDEPFEVLRLGVAPIDMYSTPLISANQGGVFVLSGPVRQGGAPDFWMELSVPAYALPADGVISVSPRPHSSVRKSGGYRFDGIGELSYCLTDYSISFTTAQGTRVEDPVLNSAIGITTKNWCFRPGGDWGLAQDEQVQLLTLDYETKRLVSHSDQAVLIDAGAKTKTFYVDHFSTWRERAYWTYVGGTVAAAWDDFTEWIAGSPAATPAPAPVPTQPADPDTPQPDDGLLGALGVNVSIKDVCVDAATANVSCGKVVATTTTECTNDGSATISASYLASIAASLGVDGGKLASAITGLSGELEMELSGGIEGGITIGASETTSMTLPDGKLVSNSLRGTCLTGTATLVRIKKKIVLSTPVVPDIPIPLTPCIRMGIKYDVGFDPAEMCHWVDAAGAAHDCTADTPLPPVRDTAKCD